MSAFPIPSTTNKPSLVRYTSPTHGELFSLCLGEVTTLKQAEDYSFRNSVRDWQIPVGSEATLIYKPAGLEHLAESMRICYLYNRESNLFSENNLALLNSVIASNQKYYDDFSSKLQITAIDLEKVCAERRTSPVKVQVDENQFYQEVGLIQSALDLDHYSECSELVSHVLKGGKLFYLMQLEVVKAQKGRGLAKNLIESFHQVAAELGIDKTYSMVDKSNPFKPAMAHLFHNSGYRGIDSMFHLEHYTDPFTFYIKGLNHTRKSSLHEE